MKRKTNQKRDNGVGYISASREGNYSKCKFNFWDSVIANGHDQYGDDYEEGFDDPIYLMFGKAMHKALEVFHTEGYKKKSELKMLYRKYYVDFGVDDREYYSLGMDICNTYWRYLRNEAPKRILIGAEIFFRIVLGQDHDGNDVYAQGTIDNVWYHGNGVYEINDYKTSAWLPSTDELEANTQIAMYDIALRSPEMSEYWYKGIEPKAIILTMNYLRHENGVLQTEIDEETREMNRLYFIDTYIQMNTKPKNFFVCRIGNLCNYCDSKERCPKYQELLESDKATIKKVLGDYDADDFAENIRKIDEYKGMKKILDNAIDELSGQCNDYIKQNDADVIVDDKVYFLGNSSQRYLLPMITIKILKQYGLWDEKEFVGRISVTKVESLCKGRPDVWDALEHKAVRRSFGSATLKSKKVPKGVLFNERRRR